MPFTRKSLAQIAPAPVSNTAGTRSRRKAGAGCVHIRQQLSKGSSNRNRAILYAAPGALSYANPPASTGRAGLKRAFSMTSWPVISKPSNVSREARSTWARLIKKIFEADPLVCGCGGRMRIVSFITDPRVVDRILRHRESELCKTERP
jgi:hypothetical protein